VLPVPQAVLCGSELWPLHLGGLSPHPGRNEAPRPVSKYSETQQRGYSKTIVERSHDNFLTPCFLHSQAALTQSLTITTGLTSTEHGTDHFEDPEDSIKDHGLIHELFYYEESDHIKYNTKFLPDEDQP